MRKSILRLCLLDIEHPDLGTTILPPLKKKKRLNLLLRTSVEDKQKAEGSYLFNVSHVTRA